MVLKEKHVIDLFKGLTLPFVLFCIYYFKQQDNVTAWVYAAVHGSYGILWCLKSRYFGDAQWERELTPLRFVLLVSGLSGYWVAPVMITYTNTQHSPMYLCVAIMCYAFGVFMHFASDMQKTMSLKLKPGHLITTGLWKYSRNPNYFGELLIYSSFCILALHWLPIVLFSSVIAIEWIPNMMRKEKSLSRYPEFAHYKSHSNLLFPCRL